MHAAASAGGGQLFLDAQVAGHQRRQLLQLVEQGEADGADQLAFVGMDRQAHHHQRSVAGLQHVQQDRLAIARHLAQQAVGNDLFHRLTDGGGGIRQAEVLGVSLVDPDDARLAVDDHRAIAGLLDDLEQRADRPLADLGVVLQVRAGRARCDSWLQRMAQLVQPALDDTLAPRRVPLVKARTTAQAGTAAAT